MVHSFIIIIVTITIMVIVNMTYKSAEDEEDHEESTDGSLAGNVTVADSGHCDQSEVDTLPVGRRHVLPLHLRK